jgi:hypothetical protein
VLLDLTALTLQCRALLLDAIAHRFNLLSLLVDSTLHLLHLVPLLADNLLLVVSLGSIVLQVEFESLHFIFEGFNLYALSLIGTLELDKSLIVVVCRCSCRVW